MDRGIMDVTSRFRFADGRFESWPGSLQDRRHPQGNPKGWTPAAQEEQTQA